MNTDLPPMNWVKTFESAARLLNFSAAARELNMTQSAVSQQIKLLEHHLGDDLFVRHHRKVTLTNSGLAYLPVVQSTLHHLQRKTADIFSPIGEGRLVLQVSYAFSSLWLAANLHDFCTRYPGIQLQLIHSNWDRDFLDGGHDLSIINGKGQWPRLQVDALLTPEVMAFCSPSLAKLVRQPADLLSLPLIEVTGVHHSWHQWFEQAGIKLDKTSVIYHRVDTLAAAALMVESGLGVMLAYPELFLSSSYEHKVKAPIELRLPTQDNYFLASPKDKPLSKSAMVFRDWLIKKMADLTNMPTP